MQIDFYGLRFEASRVTCYLWTPWRAAALEHRLFNEVKQLAGVQLESTPEELRLQIADIKVWKEAILNMSRLLKGWQEEATDGGGKEQRVYRWLFEGDTDEHGYDHANELACLWVYLRVGLDRGDMGEEPSEWIDLDGFGLRFWPLAK